MKVPEPRKLKSGLYFIQLRLGGVSVPVTASTAKECKRTAALIKAEHRAGARVVTPAKDLTLQQAVDAYLQKHKSVLSPSTYRSYDVYKRTRFLAYQDKKISEVDYQKMINDELELVSEKTVKNGWGLVHAAVTFAGVPLPKVKLAKVPVNEIPFLQPEEILPFCAAVKGKRIEIAALLELHGMRLSEVRGLTWNRVDLKKKTVTVNGARVRGKEGDVQKKTNKNDTSTRVVPIMIPQLVSALEAVPDKTGHVANIPSQTMLRGVNAACARAGITIVGNHGLRHSFASLGYHLRISERQLMAWGGWADFTTMHRIYIRLAASDENDARTSVENFFQPKKKKKKQTKAKSKAQNANKNANSLRIPQ